MKSKLIYISVIAALCQIAFLCFFPTLWNQFDLEISLVDQNKLYEVTESCTDEM